MQSTSNLSVLQASLILCVIFLIENPANQRPSTSSSLQVAAQESQIQTDGFSKINKLSSSKFRENIVQVQRSQQRPVQQQVSVQSVRVTEKQQSVNDLPLVQEDEDSQQSTYTSTNTESVYGSVQGTPGVDFPNYSAIPNTKFSCDEVPFALGMYADESTGCQVYHLCYQGRRESFLCGIGTVFNQAILNCDFWHSVDCSKSSLYYGINSEFGKSVSEPSSNSLQSFSQRTISQTEQSILPIGKVNLQAVKNYQQSSIVQPASPNFVQKQRNFESFQQFSGGKISPPRQQITSKFASQAINEQLAVPQSTKSLHTFTKASITSPSRKAAQLNRIISGAQQITSAESATVRSLSIKSGKTNFPVKSSAYQNQLVVMKQPAPDSGLKLSPSLSKSNSFASIKQQGLEQKDDQVWRPVFRNKGKTSSASTTIRPVVSSVPAAPVKQISDATSEGTTSTAQDGGSSTSEKPDLPPPTVAKPDQEPTFSSVESSEPPTASEVPSIPKSNTPPSTESPVSSTNTPTETSPSVNIESDVSSALGTTTPKPTTNPEEGSPSTSTQPEEPDSGTPATNEAPTVTTPATTTQTVGETSSQEDADSPKPTITTLIDQTTKPSDSPIDVSTTTTVSPAPEAETTTQPETTTTAKPESDDKTNQEEKAKKKRGALVAGVEYANKSDGKKIENSSSVVYVAKKESKIGI